MNIPSGFGHCAHLFGGSGAPTGAAVTYGFANGGSFSPDVAAKSLHDLFELHILPNLSGAINLVGTRVKFGPNDTGPFAEYSEVDPGGARRRWPR